MNLQTFKASTMAEALSQVKSNMGHDAVILHTRTYHIRNWLGLRRKEIIEITAGRGLPTARRQAAPQRTPAREVTYRPQQLPSPIPGQSGDPKQGISSQATGGSDERPPAVSELGISASDWARLGPAQQRELMNAAQQSGPPGYQSMIKNYYVRIARMQAEGNGGNGSRR